MTTMRHISLALATSRGPARCCAVLIGVVAALGFATQPARANECFSGPPDSDHYLLNTARRAWVVRVESVQRDPSDPNPQPAVARVERTVKGPPAALLSIGGHRCDMPLQVGQRFGLFDRGAGDLTARLQVDAYTVIPAERLLRAALPLPGADRRREPAMVMVSWLTPKIGAAVLDVAGRVVSYAPGIDPYSTTVCPGGRTILDRTSGETLTRLRLPDLRRAGTISVGAQAQTLWCITPSGSRVLVEDGRRLAIKGAKPRSLGPTTTIEDVQAGTVFFARPTAPREILAANLARGTTQHVFHSPIEINGLAVSIDARRVGVVGPFDDNAFDRQFVAVLDRRTGAVRRGRIPGSGVLGWLGDSLLVDDFGDLIRVGPQLRAGKAPIARNTGPVQITPGGDLLFEDQVGGIWRQRPNQRRPQRVGFLLEPSAGLLALR